MSWWSFGGPAHERRTCYVIDIGGVSVAGACVYIAPGKPPLICYDKRMPITLREREAPEDAMKRALGAVCDTLIAEGVPALAKAGGPRGVDETLVAIDAPWQQTLIHMEEKRSERPFTFTKHVQAEMLASSEQALTTGAAGKDRRVEQHVVSIRLNGYETAHPYNKSARRAAVIVLASWIHKVVVDAVHEVIHAKLGMRRPTIVGGLSLRYHVLAASFPREHDVLILDAAGTAVTISLVRAGTLVAVREFPSGEDEQAWVAAVIAALKEIATSYPLPRTMFIVADEEAAKEHKASLEVGVLGALWFNEAPPKIVTISHIPAAEAAFGKETSPDIRLSLMAHYLALPPLA